MTIGVKFQVSGEIEESVKRRKEGCRATAIKEERRHVGRGVMEMVVQGRRRKERPRRSWTECVSQNLRETQLPEGDVRDWSCWRAVKNIHYKEVREIMSIRNVILTYKSCL